MNPTFQFHFPGQVSGALGRFFLFSLLTLSVLVLLTSGWEQASFAVVMALLFGAPCLLLSWFFRTRIEIGETIHRTYRGKTEELVVERVRKILVRRNLWPFRQTLYFLVLEGRTGKLWPFEIDQHLWSGKRAYAKAQALAEHLGVPLEDPVADHLLSSRLIWVRWMMRGEEWKAFTFFGALCSALILLIKGLLGG